MSEICSTCGLPSDICICETIAKEDQTITVEVVRKKFGKKYTKITGLNKTEINFKDLTKKLKEKFACGGTGKEDYIELQGDHLSQIKSALVDMGFGPETIKIVKSEPRKPFRR